MRTETSSETSSTAVLRDAMLGHLVEQCARGLPRAALAARQDECAVAHDVGRDAARLFEPCSGGGVD